MNHTIVGFLIVFGSLPFVGCFGCSKEWKTVQVAKGSGSARVIVYSPPYGKNAAQPDVVTVSWDGEVVFTGRLPSRTSGPDGMPIMLLEILSNPGNHSLQVDASVSKKQTVQLKENETRHYKIFGLEKGKETLIEDLGDDPRFL